MRLSIHYLLVVAVTCLGCARETEAPTEVNQVARTNAKPVKLSATTASLTGQNSRDTGRDPVWATEQLSEQIMSRLHAVEVLIVDGELRSLEHADWVSREFQCEPQAFDPTWETVYEDHATRVERQISTSSINELAEHPATLGIDLSSVGRNAFVQFLLHWSAKQAETQQVHTKFKVASIDQAAERVTANILAHVSGELPSVRHEINSTWLTHWNRLPDGSLQLERLDSLRSERAESQRQAGAIFMDVTRSAMQQVPAYQSQLTRGLNEWLDRLELGVGIIPTGYQGIAVGDANGDGLDDVFIPQPGGVLTGLPNRLLLQSDDGTLVDVSKHAGVDWMLETHGALFLDVDNDGDQDLIAATVAGLVFLENTGDAKFVRRATKLMPEAPPISLAAADYDHDGDLDVYACCYSHRSSSDIIGRPLPYHDANNGGRNALFRNDGNWRFRNVTKRSGMDTNNRRFSFAAAWEDYDNDGDQDLYVSNDYGRNNLFRNDGWRFVDVANELNVEDISAGMSASWGDYNRDGWMDVYVGNMWSSAGNRIAYQRNFQPQASSDVQALFQRHARGNSLFMNPGARDSSAPFQDVSLDAAVAMARWAWSSRFADINNDGWEDIVVANGFITQEDTSDL